MCVTINQLKYFLAVCEFGKIRITSERLHVSEPTISISIKRLEEEFGTPLFIRNRQQMVLTNAGNWLKGRAFDVVERFVQLEQEIQNAPSDQRAIRLGTPPTLGEHLCSHLVTEFMKEYPSVRVEMPLFSSSDAAQQVEDEKLQFAIVNQLAVQSTQLAFAPIIRSALLGISRDDHPLAKEQKVTPQMLKDEKIILISEKSMTSREVLRWFTNAGISPNIFMYSNRTNFTFSMIKQNNAIAFFLDDLHTINAKSSPFPPENTASFALDPPIYATIGIIRKKNAKLTKSAQHFFDFCSYYYLEKPEYS